MKRLLILCEHVSNHVLFPAVARLKDYFELAILNIKHEHVRTHIDVADVVIVRDEFDGETSKYMLGIPKDKKKVIFVARGMKFPLIEELDYYDYIFCQTQWEIDFWGIPAEKAVLAYGVHSCTCPPEEKRNDTIMQTYQIEDGKKTSLLQIEGQMYTLADMPLENFYRLLVKVSYLSVPFEPLAGRGFNIILQARSVGVCNFEVHPNNYQLNEACTAPLKTEVDYAKILFDKLLFMCVAHKQQRLALLYEATNDDKFYDGFWRAVDILKEYYNITKINTVKDDPQPDLENFDIVLLKTGFTSDMANYVCKYYKTHTKPQVLAICVSSVLMPTPDERELYDVMFYETEWYKNYAKLDSTKAIHAFGYDAVNFVRCSQNIERDIDYLMVGAIVGWKRPMLLAEKTGKRVAIGHADHEKFDRQLDAAGVEVLPPVNPDDLPQYFNRAKKCFIGATFYGGGERCVLDCRAMGVEVEIMHDNPKLRELLTCPLWDHHYYANQLLRGIELHYFSKKI